MKSFLYLLFLSTALALSASPWGRMALPDAAAASGAFTPASIPNLILWLDYTNLPSNSKPFGWTNLVQYQGAYQYWTNKGGSTMTNAAGLGMYFPGSAGSYFTNYLSGNISLTNSAVSVWICFKPTASPADDYNCILGYYDTSGNGYYTIYASATTCQMDISYFNSGTDAFGSDMTLGTLYDWCLNMGASPLTYYINGVSQGTVTYTTDTQAGATETLCTIGQDGDSDQNFEGYIKTIIVASNSLASYVSQLHTYASH